MTKKTYKVRITSMWDDGVAITGQEALVVIVREGKNKIENIPIAQDFDEPTMETWDAAKVKLIGETITIQPGPGDPWYVGFKCDDIEADYEYELELW